MSSIKIDARFFRFPEILRAGREARDLFLASLCYCAEHNTDGYIHIAAFPTIATEAGIESGQRCTDRLLNAGLWLHAENGYQIAPDFAWAIERDPAPQDERNTAEYRNWRDSVLTRDNHTCQDCGSTEPGLHVHHVFPFAEYPELRTDRANGVTLCPACHGLRHGRRLA